MAGQSEQWGARMTDLSFALRSSRQDAALYASGDATPGVSSLFYLAFLERGAAPPGSADLPMLFAPSGSAIFRGAFVFVEGTPTDADALLTELLANLTNGSNPVVFTRIAWRHAAGRYDTVETNDAPSVSAPAQLPFGRWIVEIGTGAQIDAGDDATAVISGGSGLKVKVEADGVVADAGNAPDRMVLALSGPRAGALGFAWEWQHSRLVQEFGGAQRMFFGDAPGTATRIAYPLFTPPPPPGPRPRNDLAFEVSAHPAAPLSDARTRLAFSAAPPAGYNDLAPVQMRTPTGSDITLAPNATGAVEDGAGFGFAQTSHRRRDRDGQATDVVDLYMTPVGEFTVRRVPVDNVAIMAGTAGSEFVLADLGDTLTFRNAHPAFAKGFVPGQGPGTPLDAGLTTSWVQVRKAGAAAAPAGRLATSYCAQPATATYFGSGADRKDDDYLVAVGISLAQLGALPDGENPFFPMLPYGGIYDAEGDGTGPNATVPAATVAALEAQVIEPGRRAVLAPAFDRTHGPIFFDISKTAPFDGGSARTPMGFVADFNGQDDAAPSGSVKALRLAQSPQTPGQFLELSAGSTHGVVNPTFLNAAMRDNLFMVVTDPDLLWPADAPDGRDIRLGDFTFEVNVGPRDPATEKDQPRALVVFKYVRGASFADLVKDPDRWTDFFGPGDDADKVRAQIEGYLAAAAEDADGLFANFDAIVSDPDWAGMLVFNCPLDYKALPSDLQILLGGIDGTLRAHHFGVTINQVSPAAGDGASMKIDSSSLFAVIDYEKPLETSFTPPHFQVLRLNVEYANSKLVVFNSRIAFSPGVLFDAAVSLTTAPASDDPATGTMEIDGVYTLREDGTGSLVFATDALRIFTPTGDGAARRILAAQSVENATLVPVSSTRQADGTVVARASFRLDGTLALADGIGGDLFSYGKLDGSAPPAGLAIVDYAFDMVTDIPATEGPARLGPIAADYSGIKVDQQFSTSRQGSFERGFPSRIDSVRHVAGGLGAGASGSWQVRNGDLGDVAPVFMLGFKIPMGSLGGLVSSTNTVTADLYVGWVPGQDAETDDAVGAVLVLPPLVAGPNGFDVQGIAPSAFEKVVLERQEFTPSKGSDAATAYDMRFEHFSSRLVGIPLVYGNAPRDLGIFGSPTDPGGENPLWFVGKSADTKDWKEGPRFDVDFFAGLPKLFIGRSFGIETDPTDPDVIDKAIGALDPLRDMTVAEYMSFIYANSGRYDASAGMTFALSFDFKAVKFAALFHDNDFYGAKIAIKFEKEKDKKDDGEGGEEGGTELVALGEAGDDKDKDKDGDKDKKGVNKLQGLSFSIVYRKISDHLGVWSATIYIDVGTIDVGAASLTLPDFTVSIWTNGDWRFSVGWPIDNHPVTIQFQAGPIPVIGKLGFYLAKLSSAAAPESFFVPGDPVTYPPNFKLIWSFGLAISAGVGKEFKKGPLSAEATLSVALTFEGFLGSFNGDIGKDGVDYYWFCISLALVGHVEGKVDFKIIAVSIEITLTLKVALALETLHRTHVVLTFEAEVKASIKIIFIKISFSFSATLTILDTSFGQGKFDASLDGPNPKQVAGDLPKPAGQPLPMVAMAGALMRDLVGAGGGRVAEARSAAFVSFMRTDAAADQIRAVVEAGSTEIELRFLLQSTAVTQDGTTWTPAGVATLVIVATPGDLSSPFGKLGSGMADWLLAHFGGDAGLPLAERVKNVEAALQAGEFDDRVEACLSDQFVFKVGGFGARPEAGAEPAAAVFPMHPSMGRDYDGSRVVFGATAVSPSYADAVERYFANAGQGAQAEAQAEAQEAGATSLAALIFDEYFLMLAKQLFTDLEQRLQRAPQGTLDQALAAVLGNVAGFVSRFLLGGLRLPRPDDLATLAPVHVLTGQQFPLDPGASLSATLVVQDPPDWIVLDGTPGASLATDQVYGTAPQAHPWTVTPTQPVSPVPARFPMNVNLTWTDLTATKNIVYKFADNLHLAVEAWLGENPGGDGPWLRLEQVSGSNTATAVSAPFSASGALVVPITLKTIAKPGGKPGEVLRDIFAVAGTDEVSRAYLQALLDDPGLALSSVDLAISLDQGRFASTEAPQVLVRTNLSTATAPSGAGAAVAEAMAAPAAAAPDPHYANYAKPGEGGAELARFLRLLWEVSVVHTGGFYMKVAGLDLGRFRNGTAELQVIVRTGTTAGTLRAEPYHNALIGPAPDEGHAVMANLDADAAGTPVVTYTASYPGGFASWSIRWDDPPIDADATEDPAAVLLALYSMVSYRIVSVDGTAVASNWSRPVAALHDDGSWTYQKAFPTAALVGAAGRYAAVGRSVGIEISVDDIFGNAMPPTGTDLVIGYNDDILGLAHWPGTQSVFRVGASEAAGKVAFALNLTYGSLPFSLGDLASVSGLVAALRDGGRPVSVYVWGTFGEDARKVLSDPEAAPEAVQVALLDGVNALLGGPSIYDPARFGDVTLSAQAKALLERDPSGAPLVFLNRLLLQDAYPDAIAPQIADDTDRDGIAAALAQYGKVADQLAGPGVFAAVNTGGLLAADTPADGAAPPPGALTGDGVLTGLQGFVGGVVAWLGWLSGGKTGTAPDMPAPAELSFDLDRDHPLGWDGDLRELRVGLMIARKGVDAGVARKAPDVQAVTSPVLPAQGRSTEADPTGLAAFAVGFETAYHRFDGTDAGVIKVATGTNSDLKSRRLGMQSLWLSRWGATSGITVEVLNDAATPPVYYATPPLSTQLITRKVADLVDYSGSITDPTEVASQVFSSVDLDRWAASFLASVETVFGAEMAPNVAILSQPDGDGAIYDPFVASKRRLAGSIADRLAHIYATRDDLPSDRPLAVEAMRQALLTTLENDYGVSALVQMAVDIGLHGSIEPGGTAPPNLFGAIQPRDAAGGEPPYSFSSARLPLEAGRAWLNFLLSVEDPAAQKALTLDLDFQMGFIEHNVDPAATRCDYTPSDWMTFVLQRNPATLPQGRDNTLTASLGAPRIPIPLRSYPPLPKLARATATQDTPPDKISRIDQALSWTYALSVEHLKAEQDTLILTLTFNEPPDAAPKVLAMAPSAGGSGRSGDLFDALARYSFEYPHLAPDIATLAAGGSPDAEAALKAFRDIATDVSAAWGAWTPPGPPATADEMAAREGAGTETWTFAMDETTDGTLSFSATWKPATRARPPWPRIAGYAHPPQETTGKSGEPRAVYTLSGARPQQIRMSWAGLFVLDYQSARASACIERNGNLGDEVGEATNPAFVYRTETVRMPTPSVPLIGVPGTLALPDASDLQGAITAMLDAMRTAPSGALHVSSHPAELWLEGPISYAFRLLANGGSDVRSTLPLFLMETAIEADEPSSTAASVAEANIADWRKAMTPKIDHSAMSFRLTIFATRIVRGAEKLPLVQFQDLSVAVPDDPSGWW
jgi:hypothetical protein